MGGIGQGGNIIYQGNGGGGGSATSGVVITAADFTGNDYVNASLIGKTADTEFALFTDEGSGVLLKVNDGYTFNSGTGTITTTPGNYRLQIY